MLISPVTVGKAQDKKWDTAVILQGPVGKVTQISSRKFIEQGALVIISTITPREEYILSEFERDAVDAGKLVFLFVDIPNKEDFPEFWKTNLQNQNLQRLTSYHGINYAHTLGIEFSLKIRGDVLFNRPDVIEYLKKSINEFPVINKPESSMIKSRMAVSGYWTLSSDQYPLHVCDFWRFGYTEDLIKVFDISEKSSWNQGYGRYEGPETSLSRIWLRDMNICGIETIWDIVGHFLTVIEPAEVGQVWLRHHSDIPESEEDHPGRRMTNHQWRTCVLRLLRERSYAS